MAQVKIERILQTDISSVIDDSKTLANRCFSSAKTVGVIDTKITELKILIDKLQELISALQGAINYRGILNTAEPTTEIGTQLSNFIREKYTREPAGGDLVKVYKESESEGQTVRTFDSSYLFVDDGKSSASWLKYSDTETVSSATTENKGIVEFATEEDVKAAEEASKAVSPKDVKDYVDSIDVFADEL